MEKIKFFLKACVLFLAFQPLVLTAQDYQTNFTFGKELFREGRYELAMESFKKVMTPAPDNPYAPYASFYNALSAYRAGRVYQARELFLELIQRFPSWDKKYEAYYWLGTTYFEEQKPAPALNYLNSIESPSISKDVKALKKKYLSKIDTVSQLVALLKIYPEDTVLAEQTALTIYEKPYDVFDREILSELVEKYEFDKERFGLVDFSKSVKKSTYQVAVMLPFMFSSLDDTRAILRNDIVTDLYNGMLLGIEKLEQEKKPLQLHAYDTKRSGEETGFLLEKEELTKMDLIIGPLYPEPSRLVSEFSYANNINMINPISTNPEVIGGNPYSFLLKPTNLTQAARAAEYAIDNFTENKNVLIFYEDTPRDSASAFTYSSKLEEAGFSIIKIKPLKPSDAHYLIDTLTYKEDVVIERKTQLDSMLADTVQHIVKSRSKSFANDSLVWYEEVWKISPDSIGHMMVASSNALLATNSISAVEIRPDRIPLIGREEWLEIPQVNFDQVERIGAVFISSAYIDKSKEAYIDFMEKYLKRFRTLPSGNACLGYETIVSIGRLLHSNGTLFQAGMKDGEPVPGILIPGLQYGYSNDNQVVTFLKIIESEIAEEVK